MEQAQAQAQPGMKKMASPSLPQAQAAVVAEVDRLSALDDGTLHGILARLPLRDAAAMTALSRRWPRVFATLPRLRLLLATFNHRDFPDDGDEDYCEDTERWLDALAGILNGRGAPIEAFEVHGKIMARYDDWFEGFFDELCKELKRGPGLLELGIWNSKLNDGYEVPTAVFSCKTLTKLELFSCRLRVPARLTGLRAVRSLQLRSVVASNADIRRVIAQCRAMEDLLIQDIHKARSIVVWAPSLEKLCIDSFRSLRVSVKNAPRLDAAELSLSYDWTESSWTSHDTMDSDREYSFPEIDERRDFEKMEERSTRRLTRLVIW